MDKKIVFFCGVLLFCVSFYTSQSLVSSESLSQISLNQSQIEVTNPSTDENGEQQVFSGPKTEECPINGEKLTKEEKALWEGRRPLVVMIENHTDARPQSGLSSADIVYEAVAEGGITRFATIFYCKDAQYIGPVRSARVYYISFAAEYGNNPLYAHVGGANTPGPADALGKLHTIKWAGFNDLNQFSINFPYFFRDYDRLPGRATEHTMYSSTQKLWEYAQKSRKLTNVDEDGLSWDSTYQKWEFKDDEPSKVPTAGTANFDFWSGKSAYSVEWKYAPKLNTYLRFNGGKSHIDKNTNKQLNAKNVIVLFMQESKANDGYEKGAHLLYKTTGTGKGIVFQDGNAIDITWNKKSDTAKMQLTTKTGESVKLNRGKIWFEIVPLGNVVKY